MSSSGFRVASWQRDIDVADFVDLKTRANGFDAPERLEQGGQMIRWYTEDFDINVGRRHLEQTIAHAAADDQCTAASGADGFSDRYGKI